MKEEKNQPNKKTPYHSPIILEVKFFNSLISSIT